MKRKISKNHRLYGQTLINIDNQNLYFNGLSSSCIKNFILISLKLLSPLALLSFSPSR